MNTSRMPSMDTTGMAVYLVPLTRSLWTQMGMPLTLYPYFLVAWQRSHSVLSSQTNIAGSYMEISAMKHALKMSERCTATLLIAWRVHPMYFNVWHIVGTLTGTTKISCSSSCNFCKYIPGLARTRLSSVVCSNSPISILGPFLLFMGRMHQSVWTGRCSTKLYALRCSRCVQSKMVCGLWIDVAKRLSNANRLKKEQASWPRFKFPG